MRNLIKRTAAALAVAAALTAVTATTPASAQTAPSLSGCQSTYAVLTATSGSTYSWNCSGEHDLNVYGRDFRAGGWSGAVYTYDRGAIFFCDFDYVYLNGAHVYEVYLNATKPARCN